MIDSFPDGVGNTRWAATLVDATGSGPNCFAFKHFIPLSAAAVKRGDTICNPQWRERRVGRPPSSQMRTRN